MATSTATAYRISPSAVCPRARAAELDLLIDKTLRYGPRARRRRSGRRRLRRRRSHAQHQRRPGPVLPGELAAHPRLRRRPRGRRRPPGAARRLRRRPGAGQFRRPLRAHGVDLRRSLRRFRRRPADQRRPPSLVIQWGCWNTYHVAPEYDTLAHRLLLAGPQGAAAVVGSSTLTRRIVRPAAGPGADHPALPARYAAGRCHRAGQAEGRRRRRRPARRAPRLDAARRPGAGGQPVRLAWRSAARTPRR